MLHNQLMVAGAAGPILTVAGAVVVVSKEEPGNATIHLQLGMANSVQKKMEMTQLYLKKFMMIATLKHAKVDHNF